MKRLIGTLAMMMLAFNLAAAQSGKPAGAEKKAAAQSIPPAAATTVIGSGTPGRLAKWVGTSGTNTSVLGDTLLTEDKFGNLGIGTDTPTSKLTVAGMIQTTLGGYKFPDGTVQTTAAVTGTIGIIHDATLKGDGTNGNPLGVAVPLIITGSVDTGNGVITVTNTAAGGPGLFTVGGNSSTIIGGGSGLIALGGTGGNSNFSAPGGVGVVAFGGSSGNGTGGTGGSLIGGVSTAGNGGDGAFLVGALGVGTGKKGGRGLISIPGGGTGGATTGLAGEFLGDVSVTGNLAKGGGSFKIDHPLDPENKYLYHSFVESPDMMNIYNGNVITDQNGEAAIELPDWFEALNRDFRYQLTVLGTFAQAIVSEKVKGNRFTIRTNAPNVEVSWQVTGIRRDAFANKNRIPVEVEKPERERGTYLHPEAFNQPEERGVEWARNPEAMRQLKATRARQAEMLKQTPRQ